jgi:ankyrin repeat protein
MLEASPLYYATLCGFSTLVEHLLIAYPGDINMKGGFYNTPLHAMVAKGYIEISELLLKYGADVNAMDDWGLSALHRAS